MCATPAVSQDDAQTPILYRVAPMPERPGTTGVGRRNLILAISAVCAPILWVVLMIWSPAVLHASERIVNPVKGFLDQIFSDETGVFEIVVTLPACLLAVIVLHEFGHLIAGLCVGFRLNSVHIGPLRFSPPSSFSFKVESKTGSSGRVLMIPRNSDNLAARALMLVIGGPLSNLLAAWLTILLFERNQVSNLFAGLSLLVGIGNLIPFRYLAAVSDGKRIAMILRNKVQGERWLAIIRLGADLGNGVKFKDLSPGFLANAVAVKDHSPDTVVGHIYAYGVALDKNQLEEAAYFLETSLEFSAFVPPFMREALRSDAAVFLARKRKRIDLAEQWLAEIPVKASFPGARLRAQAAILEGQGNLDGALNYLGQLEEELLKIPGPYQRELSLRFLNEWKDELKKQKVLDRA